MVYWYNFFSSLPLVPISCICRLGSVDRKNILLSLSPTPHTELGSFFCFSKMGQSRSDVSLGGEPEGRHVCLDLHSFFNGLLFAFEDLEEKYFVLTLYCIEKC